MGLLAERKGMQTAQEVLGHQHRRLKEIALALLQQISWMREQDLTDQERRVRDECIQYTSEAEKEELA